ncbi:non-hydrolyzing UDP-N-acetylglucosamine 2-epimerase [Natronorubrum sp. A-ect3]|uniref:non-hydrolyzing UDP-N-acetylglucosamine 2-epimerase n=1 Tax=Natronorubrum sp. A-ect3 TaxID=3242698 RepID=UPI00359D1392
MSNEQEIAIVLGTRPEIIKLAPIIRECEAQSIPYTVIHTGQHYSDSLTSVFFEELSLPKPEYELAVGSGTHGQQTGQMIIDIEAVLLEEEPDVVLVQGDTNSVLAGAIACCKLSIELGHVEAGLRSRDRSMPEERNRVLADHASEYLFAPTAQSKRSLREEGIDDDRIHVTGNTVVDAVRQHKRVAMAETSVFDDYDLTRGEYCLLTAHRAETVDDEDRFASLLEGVGRVAERLDQDVLYPIHPRAANAVAEFGFEIPDRVRTVDPLDYIDFLALESGAALILTDSGGVQEEACILGIPCVTLRENTERPETLTVGANVLVGTDPQSICDGAREMLDRSPNWENPFGDGDAAARIIDVIRQPETPARVAG